MRLAHDAGITTAALTDHDTFAGIDEARSEAARLGIRLIPGVELSVDHNGLKAHLLVYYADGTARALSDQLAVLRTGRDERNRAIVDRLQQLGYDIDLQAVEHAAQGPSVGRPHIADVLVERGYFAHRDEAFEKLLHDGGPGYVERPRLSAIEAIALARRSAAVPVIAHPATINTDRDGFEMLFHDLADAGLGGIEAYHSMHSPSLRAHVAELAHSLGLAATGGSDYHGSRKRDYRIRTGRGDLHIPDSVVDELESQRSR